MSMYKVVLAFDDVGRLSCTRKKQVETHLLSRRILHYLNNKRTNIFPKVQRWKIMMAARNSEIGQRTWNKECQTGIRTKLEKKNVHAEPRSRVRRNWWRNHPGTVAKNKGEKYCLVKVGLKKSISHVNVIITKIKSIQLFFSFGK